MKVTAIIPDDILHDVKEMTKGKNITDSLLIALNEWVKIKKIQSLNKEISKKPLMFSKNFSAKKIRNLNREI